MYLLSNLQLLHMMTMAATTTTTVQIGFRRIESYATGNTDFASSAWDLFLTYG
jgi:hypothetical protein